MKKRTVSGLLAALLGVMIMSMQAFAGKPADADNFYQSGSVSVQEVTFPNQYHEKSAPHRNRVLRILPHFKGGIHA